MVAVDPLWLAISRIQVPETSGIIAARNRLKAATARTRILAAQQKILALDDHPDWLTGRLKAAAEVLKNLAKSADNAEFEHQIEAALAAALSTGNSRPLREWLDAHQDQFTRSPVPCSAANQSQPNAGEKTTAATNAASPAADDGIKFGRRAEDKQNGPRSLKVDQAKIDRLMNLIGELVVEKNALPYLAQRAEAQYGVRELSREIKGKHSVINRIADEMQDAIMQVRMMAVSTVFQRFPQTGSRHLPKTRQGSATGARRRANRGRQKHRRGFGRPADSYRAQQPRSWLGDA